MSSIKNMKGMLLVLGVIVAGWFMHYGCLRNRNYDGVVSYGEIITPLGLLNLHGIPPNYLRIFGKTYRNVQGSEPFYLSVPELNSILFATLKADLQTEIHLVNLETKKAIHIDIGGRPFGSDIGSHRIKGEPYSDYIQEANTNAMIAVKVYADAREYYYFDLKSKKLIRNVMDFVDKDNRVTRRVIYVNKELVEETVFPNPSPAK